jgi:hypothetical protein
MRWKLSCITRLALYLNRLSPTESADEANLCRFFAENQRKIGC